MSNYYQLLGLDGEQVENLALLYAFNGERIIESPQSGKKSTLDTHRVASSFLIAGLYASLFDPAQAMGHFRIAARKYKEIEMPIWRICAICSGTKELLGEMVTPQEVIQFNHQHWLYSELLAEFRQVRSPLHQERTYLSNIIANFEETNISYEELLEALAAIDHSTGVQRAGGLHQVDTILNRIDGLFRIYQSDYYYKNLLGTVIPFPPILLAIAMTLLRRMLERNTSLADSYRYLNDRPVAVLFRIANEILIKGDLLR